MRGTVSSLYSVYSREDWLDSRRNGNLSLARFRVKESMLM
jgi:hypothetical protein